MLAKLAKCTSFHIHLNQLKRKPFDLVHIDVWRPASTPSSHGFKYYIHFVDGYTRYTWIYPLTLRSEVCKTIEQFVALIQTQFSTTINALQSDWGGEFRSILPHLQHLGIRFQHSCPHIHQQNGKAERKHQHITNMGFALLAQAFLPLSFWWEAFHTTVYLINRLPTPTLSNCSPFFLIFNHYPDYSFLKVFGCACFHFLKPYNRTKLQFRSAKCLFLGYSNTHRGYKCLHPSGRLYISYTVHFNHNEFPYHTLFKSSSVVPSETVIFPSFPNVTPTPTQDHPQPSPSSSSSSSTPFHSNEDFSSSSSLGSSSNVYTDSSSHTMSSSSSSTPSSSHIHNLHPIITRAKHGIFKPKVYTALTTLPSVPRSTSAALESPVWKEAMQSEFQALVDNQTWDLVPYTRDMKVISNKWLYKVKTNVDGTLERLKARLVAREFEQFAGIDFMETFSPVVKATTIRLTFALAATKGSSTAGYKQCFP